MLEFKDYNNDKPLDEADSIQTRMKKKSAMRRNKAKIAMGKKKAARKHASPEKLKARANKQARDIVFKKLAGGKSRSDMSMSARETIEKKVESKKGLIARLAKKILKKVKAADRAKFSNKDKGDGEE